MPDCLFHPDSSEYPDRSVRSLRGHRRDIYRMRPCQSIRDRRG